MSPKELSVNVELRQRNMFQLSTKHIFVGEKFLTHSDDIMHNSICIANISHQGKDNNLSLKFDWYLW